MARSLEKSKGRRSSGRFAGIPHAVMNHLDYIALSNGARSLLFEFARQYNGKNNGDLSASFSDMRERGVVSSKTTLSKLLRELEQKKFIVCTRTWIFLNPGSRCALYAITWQPIDECKGKELEISPTQTPPRVFSAQIIKMPVSKNDTSGAKNCDHKGAQRA